MYDETRQTAKWYHYVVAFIAGTFLANAVPHYVNGLSGNSFPSPSAILRASASRRPL